MKPSRATQLTGWLAETFPDLLVELGRLETHRVQHKLQGVDIRRPVYVCGLARAGSTVLLEALVECAGTASFRYRDFPFVQLPVWWRALSEKIFDFDTPPVERAHRDRIRVTPRSPEAFEELLWMHFFPHLHSIHRSQLLDASTTQAEFESFYRNTVRKLLWQESADRYVAKGNYLVCRIGYLQKLFPDAQFVIPVRHPLTQVASLLRQHEGFSRLERDDPAVLTYMRRAGHFEFGLDRRPVNCANPADSQNIQALFESGDNLAGYAEQWRVIYDFVQHFREHPGVRIVHYETLCRSPVETLASLCAWLELSVTDQQQAHWARAFSALDHSSMRLTAEQETRVMAIAGETARALGCVH